jgi:predicted nucleotidyltransferase
MIIELENRTQQEISTRTYDYLRNNLFVKTPQLSDLTALVIVGSVATGDYDKFSDIDVNVLLPETEDNSALKNFKEELKRNGSNIELRFARNYEVLEKYLNWNDDFILGEYQNCIVLQDPTGRFKEILSKFSWYPPEIFQNKVDWIFHEITYSIFKDFEPLIKRPENNRFLVEVLRVRITRYALTALRLLNRKYPIHDKKLFVNTKKLVGETNPIITPIKGLLEEKDILNIYEIIKQIRIELETELINAGLLKKENIETWLSYTTKNKNKILFE